LRSQYRLSVRLTKQLLQSLFRIDISLGSIANCQHRIAKALDSPYSEARVELCHAPIVHPDETPWFTKHKLSWLWLGATPEMAVYVIHPTRRGHVARELLGPPSEERTAVCDGYGGYRRYRRQTCWSHLGRKFHKLADSHDAVVSEFGNCVERQISVMIRVWHHWAKGFYSDRVYRPRIEWCKTGLLAKLEEGAFHENGRIRSLCQTCLKSRDAFFLFVDSKEIEPTNNFAERLLRPAVLLRKQSLGTQSTMGARFVERTQSAALCCNLQGRSVIELMADAMLGRAVSFLPAATT
jgi:transposase